MDTVIILGRHQYSCWIVVISSQLHDVWNPDQLGVSHSPLQNFHGDNNDPQQSFSFKTPIGIQLGYAQLIITCSHTTQMCFRTNSAPFYFHIGDMADIGFKPTTLQERCFHRRSSDSSMMSRTSSGSIRCQQDYQVQQKHGEGSPGSKKWGKVWASSVAETWYKKADRFQRRNGTTEQPYLLYFYYTHSGDNSLNKQ